MQSVYLQRIMKKNTVKGYKKTKPKQTQFKKSPNEYKLTYNKGLQKKRRFHSPNKQTQFKANFRQEMPKMSYLPALFYLRIYDINLRLFFSIKIKEAIFRNEQSKRF